MSAVIATVVFVLVVTAWWGALARSDRSTRSIRPGREGGEPSPARAVFGRGVVAADGTWTPVGLRGPGRPTTVGDRPGADDGPVARPVGAPTAPVGRSSS